MTLRYFELPALYRNGNSIGDYRYSIGELGNNGAQDKSIYIPIHIRKTTYENLKESTQSIEQEIIVHQLEYGKLFNVNIKKVILCGGPGTGKSILCKSMSIDSSAGIFKTIVLLDVKQLSNVDKNTDNIIFDLKTLDTLLDQENTLFILDGYDEIQQEIRVVWDYILEKGNYVLFSSRNNVVPNVKGVTYFEIQKFTQAEMDKYIEEYCILNKEKLVSNDVVNMLKILSHPNLSKINFNGMFSLIRIEEEITNYYNTLKKKIKEKISDNAISEIISSYLNLGMITEIIDLSELDNIATNTALYKKFIEQRLEREGINRGEKLQIFAKKAINLLFPGSIPAAENRDLELGEFDKIFPHNTFKEYFCAYFISEGIKNCIPDALSLIKNYKYDKKSSKVFEFTAGLLHIHYTQEKDYIPLVRFWHEIQILPRDIVGWRHTDLVVRCLNECKADQSIEIHKELLQDVKKMSLHFTKSLNNAPYLCMQLRNCGLLEDIKDEIERNSQENQDEFFFKARLAMILMQKNIELVIAKMLLEHKNWHVGDAASYHLLINLDTLRNSFNEDLIKLLKDIMVAIPFSLNIKNIEKEEKKRILEEKKGILTVEKNVLKILVKLSRYNDQVFLQSLQDKYFNKKVFYTNQAYELLEPLCSELNANCELKQKWEEAKPISNNYAFDSSVFEENKKSMYKSQKYFQDISQLDKFDFITESNRIIENIEVIFRKLNPEEKVRQIHFFRSNSFRALLTIIKKHKYVMQCVIESLQNDNIDKQYIWRKILEEFYIVFNKNDEDFCQKQVHQEDMILLTEQNDQSLLKILLKTRDSDYPQDICDYYDKKYPLGYSYILGILEYSKLHIVVMRGNIGEIKQILEQENIDINDQNNEHGETPLMLAAQNGNWKVVQILVENKADINLYIKDQGYPYRKNVINLLSEIYRELYSQQQEDKNKIISVMELLIKSRQHADEKILQKLLEDDMSFNSDRSSLDLIGCMSKDWLLSKSKLRNYQMHLEDIEYQKREHEDKVDAQGWNPKSMLSIRVYLYFRLLVKLQLHNNVELFKHDPNTINHIKREILIAVEILNNEKIRECCDASYYSVVDHQRLRRAQAENIIQQIEELNIGGEYTCYTGYSPYKGYSGHAIYVTFHKLENKKVLVRIENRSISSNSQYPDSVHSKEPWCIKDSDGIEKVIPYLIGIISLDEQKEFLIRYIEDLLEARSKTIEKVEKSTKLKKVVNWFTSREELKKIEEMEVIVRGSLSLIYSRKYPSLSTTEKEHYITHWTALRKQEDAKNCVASGHNFGIIIRTGSDFYDKLIKYEKSEVVSQVGPLDKPMRSKSNTKDKGTNFYTKNDFRKNSMIMAYGFKECIEHSNSIKYLAKEIITPLLPSSMFNKLPDVTVFIREKANKEVFWIGSHLITNIIGLKALYPSYSFTNIGGAIMNTAIYSTKYFAYQKSNKFIPHDIAPVESISDFVTQCGVSVFIGGLLGATNSLSTAWFGGIGAGKIIFDGAVGAFFHGLSCYERSWEKDTENREKTHIEIALPYAADIGIGLYMLKAINKIPNPAHTVLRDIAIIQKSLMVLNSVVIVDITTKALVKFIPEEIKEHTDITIEACISSIKESIYGLTGSISMNNAEL